MRAFFDKQIWRDASAARKWQRLAGRASCVFLAIALVALFDGLVAEMRGGSNELELLPGQSISLSGPAALKNPLNSDLKATFSPERSFLHFNLEGFFTGYWFGSGMWRGSVGAGMDAEPGHYGLRIAFRGASAQSAQKYAINIYADAKAMREASRSFFRRLLDVNPFICAALAGLSGLLLGIATYFFGRRYAKFLALLGLSEIYRANAADGRLWCLAPRDLAPREGNARMVLDSSGKLRGEARVESWRKGKLELVLLDGLAAPEGALVCLKPPLAAERELERLKTARQGGEKEFRR